MSACQSARSMAKVCEDQLLQGNEFVDELVCKICMVHVVGCNPKLTSCSHLFCGDCLDQWFVSHPSNKTWAQRARSCGEVPCPACKAPLMQHADVFAVEQHGRANSALLWRMIQSLRIKCAHVGCQWSGTHGEYQQHLEGGLCESVHSKHDLSEELQSLSGRTTASPVSSPAEFSADESEDFESLPDAIFVPDMSANCDVLPEAVQPSEVQYLAGESSRQSTKPADDLSSLIRALLEVDGSSATHTISARAVLPPPAPKELELASVRESTKATAATIANVKTPKQRKQKRAKPVPEEDRSQALLAAQAQQLHATQHQLQTQAAIWQAQVQRAVVAQQWQALAARNPQYAMAAAQMARMQQVALYQHMAMRAGHGS